MSDFSFKLDIDQRLKEASKGVDFDYKNESNIIKINPEDISNWEYRDRKEFELGDIDQLANSIKTNTQAQPIVVVKRSDEFKSDGNTTTPYIVIAGYRRWLACKKIKINVEAIIRELTFSQAVSCLMSENEKETISDYSKGIFYANILETGNIKKIDLYTKIGISKSSFNNYLSFSEIPKVIIDSIGDLSKVSSRTAYEIRNYSKKGELYINALVKISKYISEGYGEKKIKNLIEQYISPKKEKVELKKYTSSGVDLFSYSKSTIKFSKEITSSPKFKDLIKSIQKMSSELLNNKD